MQIKQIATQQNIPDRYLEQLLATLRRGGLVQSHRGAKGGYVLAREPWTITILDVISSLEGSESKPSNYEDVPVTIESMIVKEVWQEAYASATEVLENYTLQDLCDQRDARSQREIMYYI